MAKKKQLPADVPQQSPKPNADAKQEASGADSESAGRPASKKPDEPPDRPVRIDEYIDDKYDVRELDALDVPYALRSDDILDEVAASGDGIEEVDVLDLDDDETVDSGMRRHARDEANMGLGAEPRTIDELEDAAIGDAIPGDRGVTRDDERHGHALLDDEREGFDELR